VAHGPGSLAAVLSGAVVSVLLSAVALADPYITTMADVSPAPGNPLPPEVSGGEAYDVSIVFDNGGNSALNQSWGADDLRCVIFELNDARDVVISADTVLSSTESVVNNAATDGAGNLTQVLAVADSSPAPLSDGFSITGINIPGSLDYNVGGGTNRFNIGGFGDVAQVSTASNLPGSWSAPAPYSGACSVAFSTGTASVPVLPPVAWLLLSAGLAGLGALSLRRRWI
jgi:hypothetical protein